CLRRHHGPATRGPGNQIRARNWWSRQSQNHGARRSLLPLRCRASGSGAGRDLQAEVTEILSDRPLPSRPTTTLSRAKVFPHALLLHATLSRARTIFGSCAISRYDGSGVSP